MYSLCYGHVLLAFFYLVFNWKDQCNCLLFTSGSFIDALIEHWTKLQFWIDVILYKNKTSQGTSIIFFSFEVDQIPRMGKYFHVDHARRTCITVYPNMVMKSQRYAKSREKEKNEKQMKVCCFKNIVTFLWMFWKAFNGKTQGKLENMALSSDFHHLWTLLATRLVFHLFWRWQPVAHAPFQQPRNAALLKCSWPRTSDTAIWASLIVAGPYFLALLPGACHLVSCCVAQQLDSNNSVDLPRGPSVVAYISIAA